MKKKFALQYMRKNAQSTFLIYHSNNRQTVVISDNQIGFLLSSEIYLITSKFNGVLC